ncbi:MAG: 5-formyltetrahydrofolate cyclo-ligase [Acidimicrobiia bacterium]
MESFGKQELRQRSWAALRAADAARFPGVEGRIPNFVGAEAAAEKLTAADAWQSARVLKCNPDSPQLPVRARALSEGKTVYMAVPRLAEEKPFLKLDPDRLTVSPHRAASIKGSAANGEPVAMEEMDRIDLVVCGCVAVERTGARLGKGGGYSDIEFALATEFGLIDATTVVATTVHPSQFLDDGTIPVTDHDFPLDLIVTPDGSILTHTELTRPSGIIPDELDEDRRATIPILARR